MTRAEVLIVGAGPAGMAAASVCGDRAVWIDENATPGGQIWRGGKPGDALSRRWFGALCTQPRHGRIIDGGSGRAVLESAGGRETIEFGRIILATGARELFLPFPGWTAPKVFGAGGLQALVKAGLSVQGARVVVAGSGPLLLAVASYLRSRGARIAAVLEQAPLPRIARFLLRHPSRILPGAWMSRGLPYRTAAWVVRFTGSAVECHDGSTIGCDMLATGFGLVPNTELRAVFPDALLAGEICGVGGVEKALLEGEMAGLRALGQSTGHLEAAWRKAVRFQRDLEEAFALRAELKQLPQEDTIVCRCEDVRLGQLRQWRHWREAKLQVRCGMGPCQGRVCGPANQFLFGWEAPSPRPPFSATRIDTLIQEEEVHP